MKICDSCDIVYDVKNCPSCEAKDDTRKIMQEDKLERHRRAESRERADVFDKWLADNCHHAVPHDKLRTIPKEKQKIAKTLIRDK